MLFKKTSAEKKYYIYIFLGKTIIIIILNTNIPYETSLPFQFSIMDENGGMTCPVLG